MVIYSYVCPCLFQKIFDLSNIFVMIKVLEISSHLLQFFVDVHVIFQPEIMYFVLKIVWGGKILNADFITVISSHIFIIRISFLNLKFHLIHIFMHRKINFLVGAAYTFNFGRCEWYSYWKSMFGEAFRRHFSSWWRATMYLFQTIFQPSSTLDWVSMC